MARRRSELLLNWKDCWSDDFSKEVSDMSSYKELKEQAEDLMRQAEAARKAELSAVLADIKAKMAAYGIAVADLAGKVRVAKGSKASSAKAVKPGKVKVAKPRKPVAAKYRNSDTGETWSGRGKAPKWLAAEQAKGRKREEFLVG
jgi:DNA-binding protein H-NS